MEYFYRNHEICTYLELISKVDMSVDNLAHQTLSFTYDCGYYGNRKGREPELLANFGKIFGYHGNQITKTNDFEIASHRTLIVQQFDLSYVFLCYKIKMIQPK